MIYLLASMLRPMRSHAYGPGSFYIPLDGSIVAAIVVGSIALPLILIVFFLRRARQSSRVEQHLLATGLPGTARVLNLQHGGVVMTSGVQRHLSVILSLEVHLPGRAPYTSQVKKFVSELNLASFQPGAWLAVRVDPMNPTSVAVAGVAAPPAPGVQSTAPMGG